VSDEAAITSAQRLSIPADVGMDFHFDTNAKPSDRVASDEELVRRIRAEACPRAMEELFDQYFRLVLSIALRVLRDNGEAEDLMQEVFLEVFRKIDQYDRQRGSVKVWIMQVAYHRSFDRRNYLTARKFYDQRELSSNLALLNQRCIPSDAWHGLTPNELEGLLRQAMAQLNERQRQTIKLVYFDGMDLREVAEKLGESYRNARNHLFRGMQNLRAIVHDLTAQNGNGSRR
jgi:RNA polymerase sigma-70 factor, ECF subfamily